MTHILAFSLLKAAISTGVSVASFFVGLTRGYEVRHFEIPSLAKDSHSPSLNYINSLRSHEALRFSSTNNSKFNFNN
jgi:hypothetical protein